MTPGDDPLVREARELAYHHHKAFNNQTASLLTRLADRLAAEGREATGEPVDVEAVAWAYRKLLAFGVGSVKAEDAHMLDRLNLMLQAPPVAALNKEGNRG